MLAMAMASLMSAGAAQADPSIRVAVSADPVESAPAQFTISGDATTAGVDRIAVGVKSQGGQGCAANPEADDSQSVYDDSVDGGGTFTRSADFAFALAGPYLICAWLEDVTTSDHVVAATVSLPVAVRAPHLALAVAAPVAVTVGQTFQVVTTAQAEVVRPASEYILPDGGTGCPANADAAALPATAVVAPFTPWNVIGGPFSQSINETIHDPGAYVACAYFEYPQDTTPPEAQATARFVVSAPAADCVVPSIGSDETLTAAKAAITGSGCTTGAVVSTTSQTVPKGTVVRLGAAAGTHLAPGAAVAVVISSGPLCIIPTVVPGERLAAVKTAIRAGRCSIGRTVAVRRRGVRKGRVVSISPRPHSREPAGQPVTIRVSAG